MGKRKDGIGKRLHPATWGCVGCSGITLLMVILGSIALRGIIEDLAASGDDVALIGARPVLEHVPGGVVRRELTGGQWLHVSSLAWRSEDSLTYTAIAMPRMSDLMMAATYGDMKPDADDVDMIVRSVEMGARLVCEPIREYNFSQGADQVLVSMAENALVGFYGLAWSPDGTQLVISIAPPDQVVDAQDIYPTGMLYLVSVEEAGGWRKLTSGSLPEWSPDGEWIGFVRISEEKKKKIDYSVIRPDGSGERRVGKKNAWGWTSKDGRCVSVYSKTWPEGERETSAWELRHVNLADGATRQVKPQAELEELGPLSATERGVARRPEGAKGETVTWVGAIEPANGRVRWLSKNVRGCWCVRAEILDGKALLMKGTSGEKMDEDHLAVFSTIDGRLRVLPGLVRTSSPAVSGGTRIAWVERREATLYGFVPIPVCDIAVLEITRPEELLTGPIPEQD